MERQWARIENPTLVFAFDVNNNIPDVRQFKNSKEMVMYFEIWMRSYLKHNNADTFAFRRVENTIEIKPFYKKEDFIALKTTFCEPKKGFSFKKRPSFSKQELEADQGYNLVSVRQYHDLTATLLSIKEEVERSL